MYTNYYCAHGTDGLLARKIHFSISWHLNVVCNHNNLEFILLLIRKIKNKQLYIELKIEKLYFKLKFIIVKLKNKGTFSIRNTRLRISRRLYNIMWLRIINLFYQWIIVFEVIPFHYDQFLWSAFGKNVKTTFMCLKIIFNFWLFEFVQIIFRYKIWEIIPFQINTFWEIIPFQPEYSVKILKKL